MMTSKENYCFLCRRQLVPSTFLPVKVEPNLSPSPVTLPQPQPPKMFPLLCITRYLHIKIGREVLDQRSSSLSPSINLGQCEECGIITDKFSKLYRQLEKTEMELAHWYSLIHGKIESGSDKPTNISNNLGRLLRMQIKEKYFNKLASTLPRIKLKISNPNRKVSLGKDVKLNVADISKPCTTVNISNSCPDPDLEIGDVKIRQEEIDDSIPHLISYGDGISHSDSDKNDEDSTTDGEQISSRSKKMSKPVRRTNSKLEKTFELPEPDFTGEQTEAKTPEEESRSSSRLRTVHRCAKCMKTFSTPGKLKEHQHSHQDEDDIDESGNDSSMTGEDTSEPDRLDLTVDSGSDGSEYDHETEEKLSTVDGAPDGWDATVTPTALLISNKSRSKMKTKNRNVTFDPNTCKYTCLICLNQFKYSQSFTRHFDSTHAKIRFQCDDCGKLFKRRQYLKRHHGNVHANLPQCNNNRRICQICGKILASSSNLSSHLKYVHSELRPHQCVQCGKKFKQKCTLNLHQLMVHRKHKKAMKISNGVRHECRTCAKTFADSYYLKMHQRLCGTSGGKPAMGQGFKCETDNCGKIFTARHHLKRHVRLVHLKMYDFACDTCKKRFKQKDQLNVHIAKAHACEVRDESSYIVFKE